MAVVSRLAVDILIVVVGLIIYVLFFERRK